MNVLIYAHREDAPEHARYAAWLRSLTAADAPFALSDVVLSGFLRIVTNARVFDPLTPMDAALAFCQQLVDWPRASLVTPGRRHWEIFAGLCRDVTGPLVADAHIAALAIEHGCELVTTDSDFARFPGLRWRHPLAAMSPWRGLGLDSPLDDFRRARLVTPPADLSRQVGHVAQPNLLADRTCQALRVGRRQVDAGRCLWARGRREGRVPDPREAGSCRGRAQVRIVG